MKTTKRRKVWVLSDKSDGHNAFSLDPPLAKAKAYWTRAGRTCTPFLESRPGDVVLSREQVKEAEALLDKALNFAAECDRRWGLSENDLRALLRGGR